MIRAEPIDDELDRRKPRASGDDPLYDPDERTKIE